MTHKYSVAVWQLGRLDTSYRYITTYEGSSLLLALYHFFKTRYIPQRQYVQLHRN